MKKTNDLEIVKVSAVNLYETKIPIFIKVSVFQFLVELRRYQLLSKGRRHFGILWVHSCLMQQ